ncbi:hypothetical protein ACJX0J_011541, partial [Zea mays]
GGASKQEIAEIDVFIILPLYCFLHCISKLSCIIICVMDLSDDWIHSLETLLNGESNKDHNLLDVHFDTLASDETYIWEVNKLNYSIYNYFYVFSLICVYIAQGTTRELHRLCSLQLPNIKAVNKKSGCTTLQVNHRD